MTATYETYPLLMVARSRDRYNLTIAAVISDHMDQSCGTEDDMTRYCSCCQIRLPARVQLWHKGLEGLDILAP